MTIVPRPRGSSCGPIGLPGTSSHSEEPFSALAYVRAVSCSFHRRESISVSSEFRAARAPVIADARRAEASVEREPGGHDRERLLAADEGVCGA